MAPATVRRAVAGAASALALALLAVAGPAAPAFAHNTVIDEGPAAESTVADQPGEVWIETNDVLLDLDGATAMDVVGPDGRHYATDCPVVDGPIASVAAELGPAGEYTVAYRVVSADGHPITGDHTFTWQPADGAAVAEGTAEPVCGAAATAEPGAGADAGDESTDAAASVGGDVVWIAAAVVAVLGAGVAAFLLTRRRPAPADPADAPAADADAGPRADHASDDR
ncbi:copper resistance CopC family protein [Agromyces indicus]|uniref:Copper resistance protein CopC n=1 Tax=Agromyces indicus TaxID=758919 RepID=A0ABU1FLS3_9MICO|nr:copper resistance protein CopC [Agromyces indicus]MDR5692678.1 copper resistance protein CopC [Agromyces indicus]